MQNKSRSYNSDNCRSQPVDRGPTSDKSLSTWLSELNRAEISIQNLLQDKKSLQSLLSKANSKKEELFRVLIDYKAAVEKLNSKNSELEARVLEFDLLRSEISKIKRRSLKRNEKVEFLTARNQELEYLISELTQNRPKSSNFLHSLNLQSFESNLKSMLLKVKSFPSFHSLFKACAPSIDSFIEFIEKDQLGLALNSACKFANELMKDYEKFMARDLSPGLSEIQSSAPASINATMNYNSCQFDENNDQDRIEKLHLELKAAVARSKEVLLSRSVSSSQLNVNNSALARSESKKSIRADETKIKQPGSIKAKTSKAGISKRPTEINQKT